MNGRKQNKNVQNQRNSTQMKCACVYDNKKTKKRKKKKQNEPSKSFYNFSENEYFEKNGKNSIRTTFDGKKFISIICDCYKIEWNRNFSFDTR